MVPPAGDRAGAASPPGFTLQLIDSGLGHPLQSWQFAERDLIRIGRAAESDIVIVDQQVSRLHVELTFREGRWMLQSHGRNGTWIDGARVGEVQISDRLIFQLGSSGPMFQFLAHNQSSTSAATLDNIDPNEFDFLRIDERQKAEEVQQIVESESFRRLREEAERLRGVEGGSA